MTSILLSWVGSPVNHHVALQGDQAAASKETEVVQLGNGQRVLVPHSLPQLLHALQQRGDDSSAAPRIVAGNTGAGIYKNWPLEQLLVSITQVRGEYAF